MPSPLLPVVEKSLRISASLKADEHLAKAEMAREIVHIVRAEG